MSTVVVVPYRKKKSPHVTFPPQLPLSLPAPAAHLLGSRSAAPSARPASGTWGGGGMQPALLKENKRGGITGDAG